MQEHASGANSVAQTQLDHKPQTHVSIEQAKNAQAREREAFTRSTGVVLTSDGLVQHRAVSPVCQH
jgi:hypothetical protein